MPDIKAFEDMVAEARSLDLVRMGDALAEAQGPPPYAEEVDEDELDWLWEFRDPNAPSVEALTLPKEQGGSGLTPFQASMVLYPYRGPSMEAAGGGVDTPEAVAFAKRRRERIMAKSQKAPKEEVWQSQSPPLATSSLSGPAPSSPTPDLSSPTSLGPAPGSSSGPGLASTLPTSGPTPPSF